MTHQVFFRGVVSMLMVLGCVLMIQSGLSGESKMREYGAGDVLGGCIFLVLVALMWW